MMISVSEIFDAVLSWGFNISNIGSKMSYTQAAERDFIPINLRLGPTLKLELDDYNSLAFTVDVNKTLGAYSSGVSSR